MLTIVPKTQYAEDVATLDKDQYDQDELIEVVRTLRESDEYPLEPAFIVGYNVHELIEPYFGDEDVMDLHLTDPDDDWVLLYKIRGSALFLIRTGTHDDLGLYLKNRKNR